MICICERNAHVYIVALISYHFDWGEILVHIIGAPPLTTTSYLFEPWWEKARMLHSDLSCGEYANEGEKHLLFWLATSWLSCMQGPCIDCLMKLYCRLKNYQTLTDGVSYNWAAHTESWGEGVWRFSNCSHESKTASSRAKAQHGCSPPLTHSTHSC